MPCLLNWVTCQSLLLRWEEGLIHWNKAYIFIRGNCPNGTKSSTHFTSHSLLHAQLNKTGPIWATQSGNTVLISCDSTLSCGNDFCTLFKTHQGVCTFMKHVCLWKNGLWVQGTAFCLHNHKTDYTVVIRNTPYNYCTHKRNMIVHVLILYFTT